MKQYLLNLLVAIDQLANALLRGAPDETLSSRAHRMRVKGQRFWGWTANAIDFVAKWVFFDDNHCRNAYEAEVNGLQLWNKQ